jgi:hypothetical protein
VRLPGSSCWSRAASCCISVQSSNEAQLLQARGFQVATTVRVGGDIPRAIDEGVTEQAGKEDQ